MLTTEDISAAPYIDIITSKRIFMPILLIIFEHFQLNAPSKTNHKTFFFFFSKYKTSSTSAVLMLNEFLCWYFPSSAKRRPHLPLHPLSSTSIQMNSSEPSSNGCERDWSCTGRKLWTSMPHPQRSALLSVSKSKVIHMCAH